MDNNAGLKILVVDDEKTIRRFLKATLTTNGFKVVEASDGMEALDMSVHSHPDLIILDLGLPDMDGTEVIVKIRERSTVPIIILSVREAETDKISALDAGADDYLIKPFNAGELLARIRTIMRRLNPQSREDIYIYGKLEMDITRHVIKMKGREIKVTPVEYDLLKMLVVNAGSVITHRRILKEIWNKNEETEDAMHLLRVTVSNLRNKIESNSSRPDYVVTEPGIGYRLTE